MTLLKEKMWRVMCASGACLLVLSGVASEREALAQQPPVSVFVRVASDCASLAAEQMLLEEVRMRIPEQTKLRRSGASDAPWHLTWDTKDDVGCQLALSDAAPAPVVQIPLSVEARPEQIREAAVRVAWFISTSAPKARPEQPVDAVASVESPLPKPSEEEDPLAVSGPDALGAEPGSELPEFPVSKKPDVSEFPEFPSARAGAEVAVSPSPVSMRSDEVALTLREPGHPSVLRSLSSTLAGWRDTSPELFGTLEELGTDPPPAYVMGKPVPLGGYVSVLTEATSFDNSGAFLLSLDGGVILNERFMLGVVYQRLMNSIDVDNNWVEGERLGTLSMNQVGMSGAYIFRPKNFISVSVGSTLTIGNMSATRFDQGNELRESAKFVGSQLNAQAFMEFLPWLDAGVGLNYHYPLVLGNSQVLTLEEYNGLSVLLNLRLRIF